MLSHRSPQVFFIFVSFRQFTKKEAAIKPQLYNYSERLNCVKKD